GGGWVAAGLIALAPGLGVGNEVKQSDRPNEQLCRRQAVGFHIRDIRRRGRGPRYDRGCRHRLLCARLVGNAPVINMSLISGDEVPYRRSYLFCMGFERKVTSVEETNDRVRHVAFECLRTSR